MEEPPVAAKALPDPYQPTEQEIDQHDLTHLPYRSWWHCVRGRGKSHAHHKLEADKSHTVPHVSFDYVFLGQEDEKALPMILIRAHSTRVTYSQQFPAKVQQVASILLGKLLIASSSWVIVRIFKSLITGQLS